MTSEANKTVWVVFLGKKGGGVHLLQETELSLSQFGYLVTTIVSNISNSNLSNSIEIRTPYRSAGGLVFFLIFPIHSFIFFFRSRKKLPIALVQIMPSPMDYWIDLWSLLFKVPIFRAIHDLAPHPGELWPTKSAIKRRLIFATNIFVFSSFVGNNIENKNAKTISKCNLPVMVFPNGVVDPRLKSIVEDLDGPIVLFVGRFKEYKGLEFFLKALKNSPHLNCSFLLAGSGNIDIDLNSRISMWNQWLSEAEIDYLLTHSDIVVFPYIEASQSGMLSLAKGKRKIILVTRVGALEEQLEDYVDKIIVEPHDVKGLVKGLESCIEISGHKIKIQKSNVLENSNSLAINVIRAIQNMP